MPGPMRTFFQVVVAVAVFGALYLMPATLAQSDANRASLRPRANDSGPGGTIAYVRDSTEIRLIDADGSNDRRVWTHPDARKELGIDSLAWRPDGQELAFSSSHAAVASLYHADIYTIRRDGSGLRKLTNPPDRSEYARYPKGTVSVTVRNDQ